MKSAPVSTEREEISVEVLPIYISHLERTLERYLSNVKAKRMSRIELYEELVRKMRAGELDDYVKSIVKVTK